MNDIEHRLAEALRARADDVEPKDEHAALDHITRRVDMSRRQGLAVLGVAAAIVVAAGALVFFNRGDDKKQHVNVATDSGGASSTTATTSTTPASVIPQGSSAIWPFASSNQTFATPEDAAKSFAVDYLGMRNARVGKAEAGFEYETNVEIFPNDRATARTVVRVTNYQRHGYVVLGAMADEIQVDQPRVQDNVLTSPLRISGKSVAFEATLGIQLRPFGSITPVLSDHTNGGATEIQPFSTTITPPSIDQPLVLVVFEGDASGAGDMTKATVIPLAAAGSPPPTSFVAWTDHATLEHLDFDGHVQRQMANTASPIPTPMTYAPQTGLVAYGDRDFTDPPGPCGRGVYFASVNGGAAPAEIRGADLPAFSPDGAFLAYVDCSGTVQVRNMATGREAAAYKKDPVGGITFVRSDALIVDTSNGDLVFVPLGGDGAPTPPVGRGTVVAGRGRFETLASYDGTNISSYNPISTSTVRLVTPAAAPISLDADESGRDLIWVDVNHDLWTWSGGDPVKVGSGFDSAAW